MTVADFHRTGFNLFPELLPAGVRLRQGYRVGPIPALGAVPGADRVIFLGMHAAAGTDGFLAHTLTSRFERLTVNGRPLPEFWLFAGLVGAAGLRPAWFSGDAVACAQAEALAPGLRCCEVPVRPVSAAAREAWRARVRDEVRAAVSAPAGDLPPPVRPVGPFHIEGRLAPTGGRVSIGGPAVSVDFVAADFDAMVRTLLRLAYHQGIPAGWLPLGLRLYRVLGRHGLALARAWWGGPDRGS